jgi:hypothetical protein
MGCRGDVPFAHAVSRALAVSSMADMQEACRAAGGVHAAALEAVLTLQAR